MIDGATQSICYDWVPGAGVYYLNFFLLLFAVPSFFLLLFFLAIVCLLYFLLPGPSSFVRSVLPAFRNSTSN